MQKETKTISLPMPLGMGSVNCYLVETGAGYFLIDTGSSKNRQELVQTLESLGCKPGLLKLIILTHGDFDHTGNAAFLRTTFGGKLAMHARDAGMVESGDMFVSRNKPNFIIRLLLPVFSRFGKSEHFSPDLLLEDGEDLSEYGMEAKILSIPGHSKGSIGILTSMGELFCGDLLVNTQAPVLNSLIDDRVAANASLQKLQSLSIDTVYPGHGKPFPMHLFNKGNN